MQWISCFCLRVYCFTCIYIVLFNVLLIVHHIYVCIYLHFTFTFIYLLLIIVSRSIAICGTCIRLHERIRFEMSSAHKTHKAFMPNPKRIRWYERDKGKRSCQAHGQLDKLYILYCCKVIFYIYNVVNCTFIET